MRAMVTKAFPGVEDGKIYPRDIAVGEVVSGDLAREAIAAGNAEEVDEDKMLAAEQARLARAEEELAQKRVADLKAIAEAAKVDLGKAKTEEEIAAVLKKAGVEVPAA